MVYYLYSADFQHIKSKKFADYENMLNFASLFNT